MREYTGLPRRGHRKLIAWEKAMDLAVKVLDLCDVPVRRGAGIVGQLRRSVVSVPSNIAEGYGRTAGEYTSSLRVARGSLREVDTQLELFLRRGTAKTERLLALLGEVDETGRVPYGLLRSVSDSDHSYWA